MPDFTPDTVGHQRVVPPRAACAVRP